MKTRILWLLTFSLLGTVSLRAQDLEAEVEPPTEPLGAAEEKSEAETSIRWQTDLDEVLDIAADEQKPVLLYFSAGWCQPCQLLKSTTLRDPAVISLVEPYLKVQVDYDEDPYLVARYGITGVPAVLLLDASGERVATSVGFRESEQFQDWLARHADKVSPEAAMLAEQTRDQFIQTLTDQFASGEASQQAAALHLLFEQCVEKNIVAMTFARGKLAELASNKPALLKPFLKDSRLLVRILVGNAMNTADPSFEFDPWKAPANPAEPDKAAAGDGSEA